MSWQDFVTISPLVAGILTAAAILIVDLIRPGRAAVAVAVALIGLAITAILTLIVGRAPTPVTAFGGAYKVDALTTFLDVLFVAVIAMTIAVRPRLPRPARAAGRRVRGDPRLRDDRRDAHRGVGATCCCCSSGSS